MRMRRKAVVLMAAIVANLNIFDEAKFKAEFFPKKPLAFIGRSD
jgi:hypothetical protein